MIGPGSDKNSGNSVNSLSSAVLSPSFMIFCYMQGFIIAFQHSCTFIHLTCNVAASASPRRHILWPGRTILYSWSPIQPFILYTVHILRYIPQTQLSYAKDAHIWDIQSSGKGDVRKRIACGLGGVEISLGHSTCSLWKPSWRLWIWGSLDKTGQCVQTNTVLHGTISDQGSSNLDTTPH